MVKINIKADGSDGRVDLIGSISEWNNNNAVDFRARCKELKNSGVTTCCVYLMTKGGDCFQANEIVNILNETFGSYTCEGGSLVASAGTYIAVNATSFSMAKNGQFMIHKPSGEVYGNDNEVENYLNLLKNMTITYYNAYVAKLLKPENEFKKKWDSGDFWLTAEAAKEWGFVSHIKQETDSKTKALSDSYGNPTKPIAIRVSAGKNSVNSSLGHYTGKTFDQLQDEDPEYLEHLHKTNPEIFDALFADWRLRNINN